MRRCTTRDAGSLVQLLVLLDSNGIVIASALVVVTSLSLSFVIRVVACERVHRVAQSGQTRSSGIPVLTTRQSALGPVCCSLFPPPTIATYPLYVQTPRSRPMSRTHPTAGSSSSSSSSNFQRIINNALDTYKKRTGNDLCAHPLAAQLQACDSPTAILSLLRQQVQGLDQSRSTDERWTKWLDPTVNVLSAFSDIIGAGVSLVCFGTSESTSLRLALLYMSQVFSPASIIFAGVGLFLSVCTL